MNKVGMPWYLKIILGILYIVDGIILIISLGFAKPNVVLKYCMFYARWSWNHKNPHNLHSKNPKFFKQLRNGGRI